MKPMPHTITLETITVIFEGKSHVVSKGDPNFTALSKALKGKQWDKVSKLLTPAQGLQHWAKGKFKVVGDTIQYLGKDLPAELTDRILSMAANGENPTSMCLFWERLQRNPSYRSVKQLFGFLNHVGIPITEDGCFLAYKGVTKDYKDRYTGKLDNKPGAVQEWPRNMISDDPDLPCHEGLHVGALSYAQSFAGDGRVVVCKVDPEHVVCVPKDESQRKMRVCQYEVIGNYGAQLSSTTHKEGTPKKERKPGAEKSKPDFTRLDKMDSTALLDQSLDTLRKYAANGLKIIGASKIPGGKVSLVRAIIRVRD